MADILFQVQKQANEKYDLCVSYDGTANNFEYVGRYSSKEEAKLDAVRVKREYIEEQERKKAYEPELFVV